MEQDTFAGDVLVSILEDGTAVFQECDEIVVELDECTGYADGIGGA